VASLIELLVIIDRHNGESRYQIQED
jgi:hypothetical protein